MNKVAIMQPTYLPWSGYFGLINSVDTFVFLDSVQFAKRSWQQRNQIKSQNGPQWLTVPVLTKGKRDQLIMDAIINNEDNFRNKHIKSIESNYSKSNFFKTEAKPLFEKIKCNYKTLSLQNMELINYLCERLSIKTTLLKSSDLNYFGSKSDLLASICLEVNASEYISPPGSKIYLDFSNAFSKINIPVRYFEYSHPVYNQLWGEFIPNMSIIDMLFNCGDESINLIKTTS